MTSTAPKSKAKPRARPVPPGALLLDVRQLGDALRLSVASCWRLSALAEAGLEAGGFPRPIRLSARVVRWRLCDVSAYLAGLAGEAVQQP